MAYQNGTANGYLDLLDKIKTLALANGWSVKRDITKLWTSISPELAGVTLSNSSASVFFDNNLTTSWNGSFYIDLPFALKPVGYKISSSYTLNIQGIDDNNIMDNLVTNAAAATNNGVISTSKSYKRYYVTISNTTAEFNIFFDTTEVQSRELILYSKGLSGDSDIYVGLKTSTYPNDAKNIELITATGYSDTATFYAQPGATPIPILLYAKSGNIGYWLSANANRIMLVTKIYEPTDDYERNEVYQLAHLGFLKAYGLPSQFPAPYALSGGGLTKSARWSSVATDLIAAPIVRLPSLRYVKATSTVAGFTDTMPFTHDGDGNILSMPITIYVNYSSTTDPYSNTSVTERALIGEYDGLIKILATNGAKSEDTLTIDGDDYIVFQNGKLKTVSNYFAMRMN